MEMENQNNGKPEVLPALREDKTQPIGVLLNKVLFRKNPEATEAEIFTALKAGGFGEMYLQSVWDRVEKQDIALLKEYFATEFENPGGQRRGLYIGGTIGVGKTSLVALLARSLERKFHISQKFIHSGDLFTLFFRRDENAALEIENIRKVNILYIDDVGKEYDSDFSLAKFTNLIEYRYANFKTTFITSNLSLEDLRKRPNYEHIADRFNDPRFLLHFTLAGDSKRIR